MYVFPHQTYFIHYLMKYFYSRMLAQDSVFSPNSFFFFLPIKDSLAPQKWSAHLL